MSLAPPSSYCAGLMNLRRAPWGVSVAVIVLITACGSSSSVVGMSDPSAGPVEFERQVMLVSSVDPDVSSEVIERCVWVAATTDQRRQGLMDVVSLGAADGMLFVQDNPTSGAFWMKDTLIDLSIAYFDANGLFLEATDMTPCTSTNAADCRRYSTPSGYLFALEVNRGDLADFGIGTSSVISLSDESCSASTLAE